ncbi:MAG: MFS transporter, partial [Paracoccaceae bacterium]
MTIQGEPLINKSNPVSGSISATATDIESANAAQSIILPLPTASRFRWIVLLLIFLAITINYIDRMVMGIVAPTLRADFHIDALAYGWITAAFSTCYAVGQLISGKWLDRVGTRFGYGTAVGAWSLTSMLHAASRSIFGFGALRALLGITESPAYPGAVKTISEWFPKRERAFAMGWANSGSCAGTIIALLLVPIISTHFGWRGAFLVTGALGCLWLPFWIAFYRKPAAHRRVSAEELAYINSDPFESSAAVPWRKLLLLRQTWGFALGKFCTDPIWAFYLFWLPTFLFDRFGILKTAIIVPTIAIYLMADAGSVLGGW